MTRELRVLTVKETDYEPIAMHGGSGNCGSGCGGGCGGSCGSGGGGK